MIIKGSIVETNKVYFFIYMRQRVWLIYDLGFDGDYTRLYKWLDEIGAKECVMGGATFMFDFHNDDDKHEMFHELDSAIPINLQENPSTRIYAITKIGEDMVGRFLYGRRKTAPWFGSSNNEDNEEDG